MRAGGCACGREGEALIRAMAARYVERFDPATRLEQDRAYADAMARVAASLARRSRCRDALCGGVFLMLPCPGICEVDDCCSRRLPVLEAALARDLRTRRV